MNNKKNLDKLNNQFRRIFRRNAWIKREKSGILEKRIGINDLMERMGLKENPYANAIFTMGFPIENIAIFNKILQHMLFKDVDELKSIIQQDNVIKYQVGKRQQTSFSAFYQWFSGQIYIENKDTSPHQSIPERIQRNAKATQNSTAKALAGAIIEMKSLGDPFQSISGIDIHEINQLVQLRNKVAEEIMVPFQNVLSPTVSFQGKISLDHTEKQIKSGEGNIFIGTQDVSNIINSDNKNELLEFLSQAIFSEESSMEKDTYEITGLVELNNTELSYYHASLSYTITIHDKDSKQVASLTTESSKLVKCFFPFQRMLLLSTYWSQMDVLNLYLNVSTEIHDFLKTFAKIALFYKELDTEYCFAELSTDNLMIIDMQDFYYPFKYKDKEEIVTNKILMTDSQSYLITGPTSGGKSSVLNAIALNQFLAQCGAPIFASRATLSMRDRIYYHHIVGNHIKNMESRYQDELNRADNMYNQVTDKSLMFFDESFTGVDPKNGMFQCEQILDGTSKHCTVLMSTHYRELVKAESLQGNKNVKNKHMAMTKTKKNGYVPNYMLKHGPFPKHINYGEVALRGLNLYSENISERIQANIDKREREKSEQENESTIAA